MTAGPLRRLLIPGLMTLVMLATLLGLGTWQVSRLLWKQGVLDAIALAEQHPPVPLGPGPAPFTRIRAEGRFDPTVALYGAEVRTVAGAAVGGARLLGVLRREGAAPVLVDRGWVPVPVPAVPAGPASFDAYVRLTEPGNWFTPADDLPARRFWRLDPASVGAALGVPDLAPFVLVALGPPGIPDPARTLPRPPNNHLAYAITWYGLAIGLIVVFILYARKVRP